MSIDALSWAFNLELPSSGVKLTLLALANYANEHGEAFPSQKAMAEKTCLCERAIRTHLATLEALGIINREGRTRANGSFTSDFFTLNLSQRQILPAANSASGKNSTSQRQILPNPAANSAAPYPSLNTTITKSNHQANSFLQFWKAYPNKTGKGAAEKSWKKEKPPLEEVLKALAWQIKTEKWIDGFIPNPATYLNQCRWQDEPQEKASPNSTQAIQKCEICNKIANVNTSHGWRCAGHIATRVNSGATT